MLKRVIFASMAALLLLTAASPVWAAQGGSGGVHFGPYTLAPGDSVTGDLVVFGPVTLGQGSSLTGDLTTFGALEIREEATVRGDVAVFGAADIAGTVEGDVFSAGELRLDSTAHIQGDVSSTGTVTQEEGAVVEGEIQKAERIQGFNWNFPFGPSTFDNGDGPEPPIRGTQPSQPLWLQALWKVVRSVLTIVVLGLFALFFVSLWPQHVGRVAETIVNVPLPAFGVGLLVFIGAALVLVILVITICLSPLAVVGALIVGVGAALGWVALGSVLGERVLHGIFKVEQASPVATAVLGTVLLTILAVLVQVTWDWLPLILIWPLIALGVGAVTLTQFGTRPYAATGAALPPAAPPAIPSRRPVAPVSPASPAPAPVAPAAPEAVEVPEAPDAEVLPSPLGEDAP